MRQIYIHVASQTMRTGVQTSPPRDLVRFSIIMKRERSTLGEDFSEQKTHLLR